MSKVCVIKQPAGIGDILYCLKIAHHYKDAGYDVVWPVSPANMYLNEYIKDLTFVDSTSEFQHREIYMSNSPHRSDTKRYTFLPIYLAIESIRRNTRMNAKYEVAGVNNDHWPSYMNIQRKLDKEHSLFRHLGLDDNEPYALINRNYYPWHGHHKTLAETGDFPAANDRVGKFRVSTDIKQINMSRIEGYTVFDWMLVMGKASEIWTMDTCIILLIEEIKMMPDVKLNMFIRDGASRLSIGSLVSKPWRVKELKWSF